MNLKQDKTPLKHGDEVNFLMYKTIIEIKMY